MHSREKFNVYSSDDFVWNEHFRKWVLSPDDVSNDFWSNWLIAYPGKSQLINAAKEVILCLNITEPLLSEESIDKAVQNTLTKLKERK